MIYNLCAGRGRHPNHLKPLSKFSDIFLPPPRRPKLFWNWQTRHNCNFQNTSDHIKRQWLLCDDKYCFLELYTWKDKLFSSATSFSFYVQSSFQATKSFESLLIPQLPSSPPDVEAMRIYLILSECPALQDSKNYIRLTIPLAMAILRLDTNPSKVLGIIRACTHLRSF